MNQIPKTHILFVFFNNKKYIKTTQRKQTHTSWDSLCGFWCVYNVHCSSGQKSISHLLPKHIFIFRLLCVYVLFLLRELNPFSEILFDIIVCDENIENTDWAQNMLVKQKRDREKENKWNQERNDDNNKNNNIICDATTATQKRRKKNVYGKANQRNRKCRSNVWMSRSSVAFHVK